MGRSPVARAHLRRKDDSGFTLVEAVVALFVLGIIFTALAAAAMGSIRASYNSRAEQQAIDFATEALEQARRADYYTLGHDSTDLAVDTHISPCGTADCFDAGQGNEELVTLPGASVNPHTRVISSAVNNGVDFQVSTYVTKASSTGADFKRVTVVTRWTIAGHQRERMSSSILTATSRGLPIPLFTFKVAANAQTINPDVDAVFKVEITNQGAPDRWDLTTDDGVWEFWRDNGDNVLCVDTAGCGAGVAIDTLMTDGDDPGTIVDTGRMDPTTAIVVWAVRKGSSNASLGDHWTKLTATAVSVDHAGVQAGVGVQTLALLTRVTNDVITEPPVQVSPSPTTGSPVGPDVPRNVTATVGDGQLTVNWLSPSNLGTGTLTDYVVEYKGPSDASWSSEGTVSTAETQVLTGLTNDFLYEVRVAAKTTVGTGPWAGTQGTPTGGAVYLQPTFCPDSVPSVPDTPAAANRVDYTLLSKKVGGWPGTGTPPALSTSAQGVKLPAMPGAAPDLPALTTLPVLSSDVDATARGRVILGGGGLVSGLNTQNDTEYFADWHVPADSNKRRYSGTAVLTLWVAPAPGATGAGFNLAAQLYRSTDADNVMDGANTAGLTGNGANGDSDAVARSASAWCDGVSWQKVTFGLPLAMKNNKYLDANESLGVRVWNVGGGSFSNKIRIAYDVAGDFPASLVLPQVGVV
jgi:type II secretory pathway pseudopilin PulG